MISCKRASELTSKALDEPLTLREKILLWIHFAICSACRTFVQHARVLRRVFSNPDHRHYELAIVNNSIPEGAKDRVKSRLLKRG